MKLWLKFLIGTILGLIFGVYLPVNDASMEVMNFFQNLFVNISMYAVFPLIFFSTAISLVKLKKDHKLVRLLLRSIGYLLAAAVLITIVGIFSVLVFSPGGFQLSSAESIDYSVKSFPAFMYEVFPENSFRALISNGFFLFPLYVLSFILGLNFSFDKVVTRPVVQLFDSFSRIFFNINKYIVQLLSFGMIFLTAYFLFQIRSSEEIVVFKHLTAFLIINTAVIILGILPALYYFLGSRENPYKLLFGSISTLLISFFSGNNYTALPLVIKNGRQNLGVPRKVGSVTYPLFAMFSRAGSAMIISISFILLISSYTSLGPDFGEIVKIGILSILLSFVTGTIPRGGTFFAIAILCGIYSKEFENSYLILKPAIPLLLSFSALVDTAVMIFTTALVSKHENYLEDVELKEMI